MPYLIALGPRTQHPTTWPDVIDAYPIHLTTALRLRAAALTDAWTDGRDGWTGRAVPITWRWWAVLHVDHLRRFRRLPTAGRVLAARERGA